jgi:hypothetical protein
VTLGFSVLVAGFSSVVIVGMLRAEGDVDVQHIAFSLRLLAFILGCSLLTVTGVLRAPELKAERDARIRQRAQNSGLRLGLARSPADAERTARHPRLSLGPPNKILLALPVVAGLGAAFLGFAAAMTIVLAFTGQPFGGRWDTVFHVIIIVTLLSAALDQVSLATTGLYVWGQEQAGLVVQASADADRARLTALQAQMNPHFLFNALNTVASLVASDALRAERTIENLSSVLRHTLHRSTRPLTSVDDELRFVREYLEIERQRFGERLTVSFAIDPAAAHLSVPTMSLQPLIENAIKHAISVRLEGGHIQIGVLIVGNRLHVFVQDDGPGFAPNRRDGTGLGNLRQRLRSLYGQAAALDIEPLATGVKVSISIPASSAGPTVA